MLSLSDFLLLFPPRSEETCTVELVEDRLAFIDQQESDQL